MSDENNKTTDVQCNLRWAVFVKTYKHWDDRDEEYYSDTVKSKPELQYNNGTV